MTLFNFGSWVSTLLKARGHRYIKRIPYMSGGKRRYRYIYKVTHTHRGRQAFDAEHLDIGTAFALHTEAGAEIHGHITAVQGDQVTYRIDDGDRKGESVTVSKSELLSQLNDVHGIESKLSAEREKLRSQIEIAKEKGSEKQVKRLEERLARLGGEQKRAEPALEPESEDKPSSMLLGAFSMYRILDDMDIRRSADELVSNISKNRQRDNYKPLASSNTNKEDFEDEQFIANLESVIRGFLTHALTRFKRRDSFKNLILTKVTPSIREEIVYSTRKDLLAKLGAGDGSLTLSESLDTLLRNAVTEKMIPAIEGAIQASDDKVSAQDKRDGLAGYLDFDFKTTEERDNRVPMDKAIESAQARLSQYTTKGATVKTINKKVASFDRKDINVYDFGDHGELIVGENVGGTLTYVYEAGRTMIEGTIGGSPVEVGRGSKKRKIKLTPATFRKRALRALASAIFASDSPDNVNFPANVAEVLTELEEHERTKKLDQAQKSLDAFNEEASDTHIQSGEAPTISANKASVKDLKNLTTPDRRILEGIAKNSREGSWSSSPFQYKNIVGASDGVSLVYTFAENAIPRGSDSRIPPLENVIPSHTNGFSLDSVSVKTLKRVLKNAPDSIFISGSDGAYEISTGDNRILLRVTDPRGISLSGSFSMKVATSRLKTALSTANRGLTINHGIPTEPLHIETDTGFNHVFHGMRKER